MGNMEPKIVRFGASGKPNIDPLKALLEKKRREEALQGASAVPVIEKSVGAARPSDFSSPEDSEKEQKEVQDFIDKVGTKFDGILNWTEIEKGLMNKYPSLATREKMRKNLEEIKNSLLDIVKNRPGSFLSMEDSTLEKAMKLYIARENDELNEKYKIFQSKISEICRQLPVPESKERSEEHPITTEKNYEALINVQRYDRHGHWMKIDEIDESGKKAKVIFGTGKKEERSSTLKISLNDIDSLLDKYNLTEKPKKARPEKSGETSKATKEIVALGRVKSKADANRGEMLRRLDELFNKENLKPEDKKDAQRIRNKVLLSKNFQIDPKKINVENLSAEEKEQFKAYLDGLNAELKKRVEERTAELDEFLAGFRNQKESASQEAADKTSGEITATEELPGERTAKTGEGGKKRKRTEKIDRVKVANGKENPFREETELDKWKIKADREKSYMMAQLLLGSKFKPKDEKELRALIEWRSQPERYAIRKENIRGLDLNVLTKEDLAKLEEHIESLNSEIETRRKETLEMLEKMLEKEEASSGKSAYQNPAGAPGKEEELEEIRDDEILPLEKEVSEPEKTETSAGQEEVAGADWEISSLGAEGLTEGAEAMSDKLEQIRGKLASIKKEMEEAENNYLAKKSENEKLFKGFRNLFKRESDKGEAGKEEEGLKWKYEAKKVEYEQNKIEVEEFEKEAAKNFPETLKSGEEKEKTEESEEVIKTETEKEITALPESERRKMWKNLNSLGFYIEEWKNKFFAGIAENAAKNNSDEGKHLAERGSFGRFLTSVAEGFRKDEKKARTNIDKIKEGESKKLANAAYLSGNILKYGRAATDVSKWAISSPLRYFMMGAMAFARGADAAKEARLSGEKAIDKTRIHDIDRAAEEAWEIYQQAKGEKDSVSVADLEKAYTENIPKDLLRRLNQNPKETDQSGILQSIIKYDVRKLTERIYKKLEDIEKNESLSASDKKIQKEKIFDKYSDYIKSFDRLVAQCGTVDALAMGAQYAKTASKAVIYGVTAETLAFLTQKAIENAPHIIEDIEKNIKEAETAIGKISKIISGEIESDQFSGAHGNPVTVHRGEPEFPDIKPSPIELEIQKGGNLESKLIEYLDKHPGAMERYSQLHEGQSFDSEQVAHRMALEYLNPENPEDLARHLIHPGANIELSPDGTKIISITGDDNMGYFPEKESVSDVSLETSSGSASGKIRVDISPETSPEGEEIHPSPTEEGNRFFEEIPDQEIPSGGTGEYAMDAETAAVIDKMEADLPQISDQIEELDDKILKLISGQTESVYVTTSHYTALEEWTKQKQVLEAAREQLLTKVYAGHVGSLRKFISGGDKEKWLGIEKMKAWDILEKRESIAHKFFYRIMESDQKNLSKLKEQIAPSRGETVDNWVLRVAKVMRKLGIKKIN